LRGDETGVGPVFARCSVCGRGVFTSVSPEIAGVVAEKQAQVKGQSWALMM